jgi:hypothetical protein
MLTQGTLDLMSYMMIGSGLVTFVMLTVANFDATYGRYASQSILAKVGGRSHSYVNPVAYSVFHTCETRMVPARTAVSGRCQLRALDVLRMYVTAARRHHQPVAHGIVLCALLSKVRLVLSYPIPVMNRTFIYSYLIRGGKQTPVHVFVMAAAFCAFNGYLQTAQHCRRNEVEGWTGRIMIGARRPTHDS